MQDAAEIKVRSDQFSKQIITAAIEVHRVLGPGLLESAIVLTALMCLWVVW